MNTAFWNTAHKRDRERAGDPLGLDALREAMADCLVPHLTGSTRHADDYLWVLVGLRWARNAAGPTVDVEIWEAFRRFERALKQYWFRFTARRDFLGKREVAKLCAPEQKRPNVNHPILENERATGLLGTYVASLRSIGLVDRSALTLTSAGEGLVRRVTFEAHSRTFTNWSALRAGFASREQQVRACRIDLGHRLFCEERMRRAANAMGRQPKTRSWSGLSANLATEQARVARACDAVLRAEESLVNAFSQLLDGRAVLTAGDRREVRTSCALVRAKKPIPDAWTGQPIAKAIERAWAVCASGRLIEQQLLRLHVEVAHDVRGNEVWIRSLGDESLVSFEPAFSGRDFRLESLRRLVGQTKWSPSAR